jgi:hypothetical protein
VTEVGLRVARVHHPALAHEGQQVRGPPGGHEAPGGAVPVVPRVQQRAEAAGGEAVGVQVVLVDVQRRVTPLQVPGPVPRHPVPQDQVLGPGRRADRVSLHEPQPGQHRPELAAALRQGPADRLPAEPPEIRHPASLGRALPGSGRCARQD